MNSALQETNVTKLAESKLQENLKKLQVSFFSLLIKQYSQYFVIAYTTSMTMFVSNLSVTYNFSDSAGYQCSNYRDARYSKVVFIIGEPSAANCWTATGKEKFITTLNYFARCTTFFVFHILYLSWFFFFEHMYHRKLSFCFILVLGWFDLLNQAFV